MYFCEKCQNMYYLRLSDEDENSLKYYCRKCGYEDNKLQQETIYISDENIQKKITNTEIHKNRKTQTQIQIKIYAQIKQCTRIIAGLCWSRQDSSGSKTCPCTLCECM